MKIRFLILVAAIASSGAMAPSAKAQDATSRILTNSSGTSGLPAEYEFITKLLVTFGGGLATRDAATEVNDTPTLVTNQYNIVSRRSNSDGDSTSSRLIRSDERLGFLTWVTKDTFNKDKWDVFDKKEWVEAGIPEYGFLEGFTSYLSRVVLQSNEGGGRVDLLTTTDEKDTQGGFQF